MAKRGFSLTELLVVIAIVLVIAALLFPVFNQAKARAKVSDCENRLHQAALGIQLYRTDNDGQAWLEYLDRTGGYTTAGRYKYPWNDWLPDAPYLKTGEVVWCPLPDRDPIVAYNMSHYRRISKPKQPTDTLATWYPVDPEPSRIVAFCGNHATAELEKPNPLNSSHVELWKGSYPVVREDGAASIVKSSQIELWYVWQDNTWHPNEQGTQTSSQVWRFPGESWPPSIPWL